MAEPQFKVGDLVTRGRGRVTLRVVKVRPGLAGANLVFVYDLIDPASDRSRSRRFYGVAEHNIRAKEAK
jgi:hypothetical protein